jgi:large subunit ribosomal protein L9
VGESPHQRGGLSPPRRKERIVKVILTADVPKVGKAGDLKEVASGYARNYLIANGLAIPAIGGAAKRVAAEIASRATKVDRAKQEAEEHAKQISATAITLGVKVGEGGKLFGSITNKEIADALERRGINVEKHQVLLDEPLKQLGTYKVQVKVAAHLIAEVTVTVEPKS